MRPSYYLCIILLLTVAGDGLLAHELMQKRAMHEEKQVQIRKAVRVLGVSDIAVSTEARYTRHPAASDPVVPVMDHPGALEHFPSGSYFQPIR